MRRRRSRAAGYAAPDAAGYRSFSARYRQRFNQDPVRTATLAYDAVALVAALVKTQPDPQVRFSPQVLTNPSGFTGIDGLFRFLPNGTNQRGLAVLRVTRRGRRRFRRRPAASASREFKRAFRSSLRGRRARAIQLWKMLVAVEIPGLDVDADNALDLCRIVRIARAPE